MKKLSYFLLLVFFIASSCRKDLTSLNTNPKAASKVPATTLFTQGEKSLVDNLTSTSVAVAPFRVLSQEWTENTYVYEAQVVFLLLTTQIPTFGHVYMEQMQLIQLLAFYQICKQRKNLFPTTVSDPVSLRNDLIITDILQVFTFNILVPTYGNIPYSEALNPSIPYPKYDDAKTIYADLFKRLDTCIAGLNTTGKSMGAADQIYKGDVTKWKKFASTLKLKMAMLTEDVDPTSASKCTRSSRIRCVYVKCG